MLLRHRRYLALLAFGLLATPLVVGIVKPDSPAAILKEGRYLAPAPKAPAAGDDWLRLPKEIDAYLGDHFGLRQVLIRAHKDLTRPLLGLGNDSVLVGRDGRMFYLGEEAVRQSAGLLVRDQRVADAADMLARMNEELQARGIHFLVALPPERGDDLPGRPASLGAKSRASRPSTTCFSRSSRRRACQPSICGRRSRKRAPEVRSSTCTIRIGRSGARLAAYNAIVEADSHPDWRIEPSFALGPMTLRKGGDLARMLGVGDTVSEYAEDSDAPARRRRSFSLPIRSETSVETSEKAGPTILILGNSFTGGLFPPNDFATRRVAWFG